MELGDRHLKVVRASIGTTQASGLDMGVNAMQMFAKTTSQDLETTRVLQLLNMVTLDELLNDDDYEEIMEDVGEECAKFGPIIGMKIPRRGHGAGKIYIKYDNVESASTALKALAGRKFSDRTVVASYFGEENFDTEAW
jgi:splicing factor U2AF subunit